MIAPAAREADPWDRRLRWLYLAAGAIGLLAAATLLIEKIEILEDPGYVPPWIVAANPGLLVPMTPAEAEICGFPTPLPGTAAFPVVLTPAMALFAGARLARWYWNGLLVGSTAGVVLIHWLMFQSLYRIGALCPYCMAVWVVVIPTFWYTALRQARTSTLIADSPAAGAVRLASEYHGVVLTSWYLIIAALITKRFWDYWVTLLP